MPQRFRPSGCGSFFGDHHIYEQVVPQDHFLRQLKDLIAWQELTKGWADCHKGGAEYGPLPYHPATLLKMLMLSYLYNLSERQTEDFVGDNLPARYFVGLAVDQPVPDHSTLGVFKELILRRKGAQAFEELLQRVVGLAGERGIVFGRIQVVDATHGIAAVDVGKDNQRRDGGGKPRDEDAAWGSKGRKRVRTTDGKMALVNKSFYGYKTHISLNAESEIITSVVVTPGNKTDGKQLPKLVKKDEEVGIEAEVYAGDKAYDDGDNHELLRSRGKSSALCLNAYRTRLYPEGLWADIKASGEYRQGQRDRHKVEQKNAEAKCRHGLGRCRYVGLAKYAVQGLLTALLMNLKRIVRLLYGIRFRIQAGRLVRA